MQQGTIARVTKTRSDPDAPLPPIPRGQFVLGFHDPEWGLPVGYVVEGILLAPVSEGEPIYMMRTMRRGEVMFGLFTSPPVVAVVPDGPAFAIATASSWYRLEVCGEPREFEPVARYLLRELQS